jgi:hypothetical protein
MAVYVVFLFLSLRWLGRHPSAPWIYGIALLPVLPTLFVPMSVVRYLREIDELQRKIQLEALAFAFTGTALTTLSYGFLENAGLPDLSWVWVWPLMALLWVVGLVVAKKRYS